MDAAGRQCFWTIHVIGGQLPLSNDKLNAIKIVASAQNVNCLRSLAELVLW
jgi:hypothetical protein